MSVLVVTGASRGIGAEIARAAARDSWQVCINYASSADEARSVVEQIALEGGRAIAVQADVGDDEQVAAMFEKVDRDLGPVTGLVNNAGINGGSCREWGS